jgi:hypothetical protein
MSIAIIVIKSTLFARIWRGRGKFAIASIIARSSGVVLGTSEKRVSIAMNISQIRDINFDLWRHGRMLESLSR